MHNETTTSSDPKAGHPADANGSSEHHTNTTSAEEARRQARQRAEEMVDRWGEQVGKCFSSFGHNVLKWAARAREEAEDIWAEAQALRQRKQK